MKKTDGWGQTAERRRIIRHWMKTTPESMTLSRGRLQGFIAGFVVALLLVCGAMVTSSYREQQRQFDVLAKACSEAGKRPCFVAPPFDH